MKLKEVKNGFDSLIHLQDSQTISICIYIVITFDSLIHLQDSQTNAVAQTMGAEFDSLIHLQVSQTTVKWLSRL